MRRDLELTVFVWHRPLHPGLPLNLVPGSANFIAGKETFEHYGFNVQKGWAIFFVAAFALSLRSCRRFLRSRLTLAAADDGWRYSVPYLPDGFEQAVVPDRALRRRARSVQSCSTCDAAG